MPTRPTTAEQKEDAQRLRALFDAWKRNPNLNGDRLTQEEVAHRLGTSQSTLSQRLSGRLAINQDFAVKIAAFIRCKVKDFSPSLDREIDALTQHSNSDTEDDFSLVRRVDVRVSAGQGALVYEEATKSALSFRRSFLQEIGVKSANAVVVTVKGHSMEPTIRDGSVLLISTTSKEIIDREIYAFRYDEELFVKRIVKIKGENYATSDNPDRSAYPDMHLERRDHGIEIIGRALWMGARL